MGVHGVSSSVDIAVSALRAQALRMNVIAGNIANVNSNRTPTGKPYRRKEVVLSTEDDEISGVQIGGIHSDTASEFKRLYQPGHPDADENGNVLMPNVDLPVEMMQMVMASRAYQANAAILKRYQAAVDVTLELLR